MQSDGPLFLAVGTLKFAFNILKFCSHQMTFVVLGTDTKTVLLIAPKKSCIDGGLLS